MATRIQEVIFFFLSISFLHAIPFLYSLPLSTHNRWIIDESSRQRVKLACVNWASHLTPMVAEGLDKQPIRQIVSLVVKQRFNCVRFTWATYMFTRAGSITVGEYFDQLNLTIGKQGITKHNPEVLGMTHIEAFNYVVTHLVGSGLMLILDNHVSKPQWCCEDDDGNGFFGDAEFNVNEWLGGLARVAGSFREQNKSHVVGIGLRNELRGPSQNEKEWYVNVQQGVAQIHKINPKLLVFVSGLSYATNLSFLKNKTLKLEVENKLVFEGHTYPWSNGPSEFWASRPANEMCGDRIRFLDGRLGFVRAGTSRAPLFLGEFGVNQRNLSLAEDHFLSCLLAYVADKDLDFSLWTLQGSYYVRQGHEGMEEDFGILDSSWKSLKNTKLQDRLLFVKSETRAVKVSNSSSSAMYIIFHPQTGLCVAANQAEKLTFARTCTSSTLWTRAQTEDAPIKLMGTKLCLQHVGSGRAPILSTDCSSPQSQWSLLSKSQLHLGVKGENGEFMCLDMVFPYSTTMPTMITNKCICVEDNPSCQQDPTSQWFKLVLTNIA